MELIGFVGGRSYDIILLLAKTLACFEQKVLVADWNIFRTLSAAVPVPDGLSAAKQVVAYDGFFYTEMELREEQLLEYEYVLADFGMVMHRRIEECSSVFVVSGSLPHHIRQIRELCIPKQKVRGVLIRDFMKTVRKEGKEIKEFLEDFPKSGLYYLKQDAQDLHNCFVYETAHEYRLRNASAQMQELIYGIFCEIYTVIGEKEFWQKIRKQERRGLL